MDSAVAWTDPDEVTTREELARALTALRERAGLTVRDVAKAAGLPAATVGGYFSGRHVPSASAAGQFRAVLAACGVRDRDEAARWLEAVARARRAPGRRPADATVPYRGLAGFEPGDSEWFFGREQLTATVVDRVAGTATVLPVVVVGPSGSGKSSLLRAGVLPALAASWDTVLLTPGPHPGKALDAALGERPDSPPDRPRVIVVDQLEEIFTACGEDERLDFVAGLRALAAEAGTRVVLGLRSDFYSQAVRLPELLPALQDAQIVVGAMSGDELRRAVVEPAARARVDLEEGLVDLVLRDMRPRTGARAGTAHEAGALPLMSHALLATWERGSRRRLTVADYHAIGGIDGAVARTAEEIFEGLEPDEQQVARRTLLRLVRVVDGVAVARRQVPREELAPGDGSVAAEVLERFVQARLVTADAGTAQIAHEALLWAWPRLRGWLEEDGEGLRVRRLLADAAAVWRENARDPQPLHRAAPLEAARAWAEESTHRDDLDPLEREFLDASVAHADAERTTEIRRTRRLRRLTATLAVLLLLVSGLTAFSYRATRTAAAQRDLAVSRELAMTADRLRLTDVAVARQLALAAYRVSPTREATSSLLSATATPSATRLVGATGVLQAVALSGDGTLLAVAGADTTVHLWDLSRPDAPRQPAAPLRGATGTLFAVAVSPDGRTLAAAGADGVVRRWNLTDRAHPRPLDPLTGADATVYAVRFSPDGRWLAAAGADGAVRLWDVSRPAAPIAVRLPSATTAALQTLAFSPDGHLLAAGGVEQTVWLWDLTDPASPRRVGPALTGNGGTVYSVAFDPTGRLLAAGSEDRTVHLWDVADPAHARAAGEPLAGPTAWVNAVAFSPDGRWLAGGSSDNQAWLWDVRTRHPVATLPHPGPVTALAFRDGGRGLATTSTDGVARLWPVPGPAVSDAAAGVFTVTFAPGGQVLAAARADGIQLWDVRRHDHPAPYPRPAVVPASYGRLSGTAAFTAGGRLLAGGGARGGVHLWDVADPAAPRLLSTATGPTALVEGIAFSPDGHLLAAGTDDDAAWLWDVRDPTHPALLARLTGPGSYVNSVAFAPDGRTLAAGTIDKTVWLWDLADPAHPRRLGSPLTGPGSYVYSVAFSPDGRTLAAGSDDKTVWLWDVHDRTRPRRLGSALRGPDSFVYAIAFSPDGRTLAAVGGAGAVWLWDVSDREHPVARATLFGPEGAVFTVAFSPDGQSLATGGADRTVRLWSVDPGRAAQQACAGLGAPITRAEWQRYAPDVAYQPPCPTR